MSCNLNLAIARHLLACGAQRALEHGVPMSLAIVDNGGNLLLFERMDGAPLSSVDLARNKAYSARAFNMSTRELGRLSQPGQPLYGLGTIHDDRVVTFGGGIPLRRDGDICGAVGVCGGEPDQDHDVAEVVVQALEHTLRAYDGGAKCMH